MSLQSEALLHVFKGLELEERRRLVPQLIDLSGIVNRSTVMNLPDQDKKFVEFLFKVMKTDALHKEDIDEYYKIFNDIKDNTNSGDIYMIDCFDASLYNKKGKFKISQDKATKEEFFEKIFHDWVLFRIFVTYNGKDLGKIFINKIIPPPMDWSFSSSDYEESYSSSD